MFMRSQHGLETTHCAQCLRMLKRGNLASVPGPVALSAWSCQCGSCASNAGAQVRMSGMFKPCTSILPRAQQQLWPELSATVAMGFVLYGGTAIALRLGHRPSVDFDFFSERPLELQFS